jgi:hypothetical protein
MLNLLSTRKRKTKGTREHKNLDCPMSPVKSQHRRGVLGLKSIIPFPLKYIRGLCCWVFCFAAGCFLLRYMLLIVRA